ncbi:MAG: M56 family metallopeptidase [Thermoguttaceae bacterium]
MNCFTPGYGLWAELACVLTAGTAVTVALAALASRLVRSAAWRRSIWHSALLAMAGLCLLETVGAGPAILGLLAPPMETSRRGAKDMEPTVSLPVRRTADPQTALADMAQDLAENNVRNCHPERSEGSTRIRTGSFAALRMTGRKSESYLSPNPQPVWDASLLAGHGSPPVSMGPVANREVFPAADPLQLHSPTPACCWWPALVWAAGTGILLARAAWSRVLLWRFRAQHASIESEEFRRPVAALAQRLGVRRRVAVLEAAGLRTPISFGLARPTIVLPMAFSHDFDAHQQQAVLAHELAHLANRDPLWQMVADAVCAAVWWQPAAWWARRQMRAASEDAADEASLLLPGGPAALAACLVALGRLAEQNLFHVFCDHRPRARTMKRGGFRSTLSVHGGGFRSSLGRRVERLIHLEPGSYRGSGRRGFMIAKPLLLLALVTISVFSTAWARSRATLDEGETTMGVIASSWKRSLAAVALAALVSPAPNSGVAQEREKPAVPGLREGQPNLGQMLMGGPRLGGEGRHPEITPQIRELLEQREKLMHQAGEIQGKLNEKLGQISRQVQEINAKLPHDEPTPGSRAGPGRDGRPPISGEDRQGIQHHLAELMSQEAQAREAGNMAKCEEIRREAHEIMQKLGPPPLAFDPRQPPDPGQPMAPGQPMSREDVERRAMHIQAAVENLRAAGMNELADHLRQHLNAMRRGGGWPEGPLPPHHGDDFHPGITFTAELPGGMLLPPHHGDDFHPGAMPGRGPEGPIGDLSREVRELKRQVEALQKLMSNRRAESLPPLDPEGASRVPIPRQRQRPTDPLDPEGASRR